MIVSYTDWKEAQQCYGTLYNGGVSIRKALTKFSFAHQKYWIIDDKEVHLSTGWCLRSVLSISYGIPKLRHFISRLTYIHCSSNTVHFSTFAISLVRLILRIVAKL